jgi:cell division septum initiation protein DivIVA
LQLIEENEQLKERVLQLEKQLEAKVSANDTGAAMLICRASGNECLISLTFVFEIGLDMPK